MTGLIIGVGFTLITMPYHFYDTAINRGIESGYLNLKKQSVSLLNGSIIKVKGLSEEENIKQTLWKNFHFYNYTIPLPIHHPQIESIPQIQSGLKGPLLGMKFYDLNKSKLFSFQDRLNFAFKLEVDKEKLFYLPMVKKIIVSKDIKKIWKDLFTLEVRLPRKNKQGWIEYGQQLFKIPYETLLYNLFILHTRERLFKKFNVGSIGYVPENRLGVINLKSSEKSLIKEIVFILENGVIYGMTIETKRWDVLAESIRNRFLYIIKFKLTNKLESINIYNHYKMLSYNKRTGQQGMIYLYSGWSHAGNQKEFLREMIQFLERGITNLDQLKPLYKYAFERYGTSFSLKEKRLRNFESIQNKIERKVSEEITKDIKNDGKEAPDEEGQFTNEKAKIKYYLEQGKKESVDLEESEILEN